MPFNTTATRPAQDGVAALEELLGAERRATGPASTTSPPAPTYRGAGTQIDTEERTALHFRRRPQRGQREAKYQGKYRGQGKLGNKKGLDCSKPLLSLAP